MENHSTNPGQKLLSLLTQQRYLYHELGILTVRKQQLADSDSPELMLEVINGRRKLVEKLREVNNKLRPIRSKWHKLLSQIEPCQMAKANEMAEEVQKLVSRIRDINKGVTVESSACEETKSEKSLAEIYA